MSNKLAKVDVLEPLRKERQRQKEERARRKAEFGPFSLITFLKNWALRIIHTLLLLMLVYIVITGCTVIIPTVMGFLIGSFGYTVRDNSEFLLAGLAGIFFTGWVFYISFSFVKLVWKQYIKNIKATLPDSVSKRLDDLL